MTNLSKTRDKTLRCNRKQICVRCLSKYDVKQHKLYISACWYQSHHSRNDRFGETRRHRGCIQRRIANSWTNRNCCSWQHHLPDFLLWMLWSYSWVVLHGLSGKKPNNTLWDHNFKRSSNFSMQYVFSSCWSDKLCWLSSHSFTLMIS